MTDVSSSGLLLWPGMLDILQYAIVRGRGSRVT